MYGIDAHVPEPSDKYPWITARPRRHAAKVPTTTLVRVQADQPPGDEVRLGGAVTPAVKGRKSGEWRTVPIKVIEHNG